MAPQCQKQDPPIEKDQNQNKIWSTEDTFQYLCSLVSTWESYQASQLSTSNCTAFAMSPVVTGNGGFTLTLGTYSSEEKLSTAPGFTLNLRIQPKVSSVLPEILKSAGHWIQKVIFACHIASRDRLAK